jgi:hypothetical protein
MVGTCSLGMVNEEERLEEIVLQGLIARAMEDSE